MNNHLFRKIAFIALILISSKSFAQDISVGPVQNVAYGLKHVYPVGEKSFFVSHLDKATGKKLILTHYKDFQEDASSGNLTSDDCGILVIGGKLFVFEETKVKGVSKLLAQEYGIDCKPVGTPREALSYTLTSSEDIHPKIIQSENQEYFAVYYQIVDHKKCKYAFKVYDNSFNTLKEGVFDCLFEEMGHRIKEELLSDKGDFYFMVDEGKMSTFDRDEIIGSYVWKLENSTLNQTKVEFQGKTISEIRVIPNDDGSASCIGMSTSDKVKELFIGTLDFNLSKFNVSKSYELSQDFIGFEGDFGYNITDVVKSENGEMVFIIEQYVEVKDNGSTESRPYITYYDIKALAIDKNQNLTWTKRLGHCNQISYFGHYEKSFISHSTGNQFVLYTSLNKDKDGMEKPVTFTQRNDPKAIASNCLGKISIDIKSGDVNRKLLCSEVNSDWLFDENDSAYDPYDNGVLMVLRENTTKYHFGVAPF